MAYQDIEEMRFYQRAEKVADTVWETVSSWDSFARDTVGQQVARAVDSIGANIAESSGRFHPGDVVRFLHYARGSLKESRFWLRRAQSRQLISETKASLLTQEFNQLGRELNNYISYQRNRTIKEETAIYDVHPSNNHQ